MAFLRPGSRSAKAFGVAFDTDRDTREPASIALHGSGRFEHLEAQERRQKLPIFGVREHILKLIEEHATTIIVGETGCGKSTQVPQYLLESGWADDGYRVVCTQPRRVAAMMVAGQVAEEMGCAVGEEVGYAIRFEDVSSPGRTRLTYVTDGLLMREMMDDPLLSGYSVVMVDEAHERSCMTDLLLGLLKQIQRQRPQLRLVIASATLDAKGIASFFDTAGTAAARPGAPSRTPAVISVEGRNHPVTLHYLQQPAADYVRAAVDAVVAIHKQDLPGDVLIFLTGAEDCQDCVALMQEEARQLKKSRLALQLLPLPLYAGLEFSAQRRALSAAPRGFRKAIVATNVAETSLTIEGVTSVVDCGFAKQRCYNPLTGLDSLLIAPISQAEFQGRLRRAQVPEVQRSELSGVVLQLKALGVRNLLRFPFLDPPPAEAMVRALELLYALRAIDDLAELTPHPGAQMAELPVSPMLAAALLSSAELGCSEELLTIAACLGVTSVWAPQGRRAQDEAKERFAVAEGDLITYLNVFKRGKWCSENGINAKAMLRASDIRLQLRHHLRALSVPLKSCDGDVAAVQKALVKGLFANAVRFDRTLVNPHAPDAPGTHLYQLVRLEGGASSGIQLRIHPSSVLWRCRPQWALFWSVQQTDRGWFDMQDLVAVQPEWIAEAAPEMFEFSRP